MDPSTIGTILSTVGPLGVLVLAVVWVMTVRRENNGRNGRYQVVVAKLDGLREDIGEVKVDVRELRSSLVRHLEDHANT